MDFIEFIKIFFIGIIEGITEWLPVSSTGHIMIFERFFPLNFSDDFVNLFEYFIQLGAILAVVVCFWKRITPFKTQIKGEGKIERRRLSLNKEALSLWGKVLVACIPALLAFLIDKLLEKYITGKSEVIVVAIALIFYGVVFIVVETLNKDKSPKITEISEIGYKTAFLIGLFQVLAAVPGTSRSGITIIGALLLGVSRVAAAEFTFLLAIPTMIGASGYKILNYFLKGNGIDAPMFSALLFGSLIAFVVSLFSVKFLMGFVKKHDFKPFGIYRILLGVAVIAICVLF